MRPPWSLDLLRGANRETCTRHHLFTEQGRRYLRVIGMVRDEGIAPPTPVWKTGVYL